ncbi:triose-phosphate isomerase [Patescibacteria group bacterium]|nr:triose-phosphate isomerase [Patescibacteria group bacterium]
MKPLIVANWKMNPVDSSDAAKLFGRVANEISSQKHIEVVLCPPFPFIFQLIAHEPDIHIGAQDCFWEQEGAFTGEVSPVMLKALGCSHVILGHSERKKYLFETAEMINKKLKAVLQAGLTPVVCIGEHVEQEMKEVLGDVDNTSNIVLVYEPEWAISTSENAPRPATPQDCKEAIEKMRSILDVPILYGGSVVSTNIARFIKEGGASGALVGSASLDAQEFIALVKEADSA